MNVIRNFEIGAAATVLIIMLMIGVGVAVGRALGRWSRVAGRQARRQLEQGPGPGWAAHAQGACRTAGRACPWCDLEGLSGFLRAADTDVGSMTLEDETAWRLATGRQIAGAWQSDLPGGQLPWWAAPDAPRRSSYGGNSGSMGTDYGHGGYGGPAVSVPPSTGPPPPSSPPPARPEGDWLDRLITDAKRWQDPGAGEDDGFRSALADVVRVWIKDADRDARRFMMGEGRSHVMG